MILLALVFALLVVTSYVVASKARAKRLQAQRRAEIEAERRDYEKNPPAQLDYEYIEWLEAQLRRQNGDQ